MKSTTKLYNITFEVCREYQATLEVPIDKVGPSTYFHELQEDPDEFEIWLYKNKGLSTSQRAVLIHAYPLAQEQEDVVKVGKKHPLAGSQ